MSSFANTILTKIFQSYPQVNVIRSNPATLPTVLTRELLLSDVQFGYVCAIKADGDRALLFIIDIGDVKHIFLYDRKNNVTILDSSLAKKVHISTFLLDVEAANVTLFDVEIIENDILIFDALCIDNEIIINACYLTRHGMLTTYCQNQHQPEIEIPKSVMYWRTGRDYFYIMDRIVMPKPIFPTSELNELWSQYPRSEGIIFTKLQTRYTPFRYSLQNTLKWKKPKRISIDFLISSKSQGVISTIMDDKLTIYTSSTEGNVSLSVLADKKRNITLCRGHVTQPERYDGTIGEFVFRNGVWRMIGLRTDKTTPNSLETALSTLGTLVDPVTIQELITYLC